MNIPHMSAIVAAAGAALVVQACGGGAPKPPADDPAPPPAVAAVAPPPADPVASAAPPPAAPSASAAPAADDPVAMLEAAAKETSLPECRDYFNALAKCMPRAPAKHHAEMLNGFDAMKHKSRAGASAEELEYAKGRCKVSHIIGIPNNEYCKK